MRAFFVVAAIALAAFAASADVSLKFEAGANLTNAEADFSFRYSSTQVVDLISKFLLWSSLSVDANAVNASASADVDVMFGIGGLPSQVNVPLAIFAYGSGSAALGVNILSFAQSLVCPSARLDANFAGGVIAMAALDMQEFDPDGNAVGKPIPFVVPLLSQCTPRNVDSDDENLKGLSCTFSPSNTNAKVTTTYVTSKVAGILEYGQTPVSPRSYEMIIEVDGFALTDTKNHVRMRVGLLTASGAGSVEGSANVVHREGKEDLYVAASNYAVVDGKRVEVEVNVNSGNTGIDGVAEVVLEAALSGNVDAQIATVDFPAGATSFVYDPAVGAGKDVYQAGASTIALSALVALVCALLYLF